MTSTVVRMVVVWLAFSGLIALASGDQHLLLDTTKESMLDWTRYPYGPNSPTPGWVEESFTNFEKGINWRSYVVCDVGYSNVNNWLWTPFITRSRIHSCAFVLAFRKEHVGQT